MRGALWSACRCFLCWEEGPTWIDLLARVIYKKGPQNQYLADDVALATSPRSHEAAGLSSATGMPLFGMGLLL
jgi:hypothetical protein